MRWVALGVDYEMAGKDLIDSVTQSSKIARILGARPPEGFNYELFLDENGEKISKSKGNGVTLDEWLRYGPQESLTFYLYREPKRAKQLSFGVIPRAIDEYQQFLAAYPNQPVEQQLGNLSTTSTAGRCRTRGCRSPSLCSSTWSASPPPTTRSCSGVSCGNM
jgi:lysyl-tRNA synthetase class 1